MDFQDYLKEKFKDPEYKLRFDKHYQEALATYNKNFFQKTINTPIGHFTRGQIILLTLSILSCLVIGWMFVIGLYVAIG